MRERERARKGETHRRDREPHRRYAVFKPGIISCITEIQKERVKRNKVEWSRRLGALFRTNTSVTGDSKMSHPGITALSKSMHITN